MQASSKALPSWLTIWTELGSDVALSLTNRLSIHAYLALMAYQQTRS